MADLPFPLRAPLAGRLSAVADLEGKVVGALEALGPLSGRDVVLLGDGGAFTGRLESAGIRARPVPLTAPLHLDVGDAAADVVVSLWSGFRGVGAADLTEADRVLRTGGRLLVVHDYGRDDVSGLRDPDAPEYEVWSHRAGPFLRDAGFRIRVVHCFWTFGSIEEAGTFLADGFGERGELVARRMRRPRLTWNVAIYHRDRAA